MSNFGRTITLRKEKRKKKREIERLCIHILLQVLLINKNRTYHIGFINAI